MGCLGFFNFASFDSLGRYPQPFDLSAGQFNSNTLEVGAKFSLVDFNQLQTNSTRFFADPFVDDPAPDSGTLTCYCANPRHKLFSLLHGMHSDKVKELIIHPPLIWVRQI